jgi:hypothetical protein
VRASDLLFAERHSAAGKQQILRGAEAFLRMTISQGELP